MRKLSAINRYLYYQLRYESLIFWLINSAIIVGFILLAFLFANKANFGLTPSVPVYVIGIIIGVKWVQRTLSYMLRLGVNRLQYCLGSIVFILCYNMINSLIIVGFVGLFKLLEAQGYEATMLLLHPVQLYSSSATLWDTFLVDFVLLNILTLFSVIASIVFHRYGKLGGYLLLAILSVLLILSLAFNWFIPLYETIISSTMVTLTLGGIVVMAALAVIIVGSVRKISI